MPSVIIEHDAGCEVSKVYLDDVLVEADWVSVSHLHDATKVVHEKRMVLIYRGDPHPTLQRLHTAVKNDPTITLLRRDT